MRFAFTDEQLAFRDAARDLLARECPPSYVRSAWTGDGVDARKVWFALAEMGVLGALLEASAVDVILVIEETGYAAVPEPVVEHAMVGVPLLPDIIDGQHTITASDDPKCVVPFADRADRFLLLVDKRLVLVGQQGVVALDNLESVDGARRSAIVDYSRVETQFSERETTQAFDRGALGTAAQLIGLTRRMLDMTVEYVKERQQFGVPIGSFQAVKHHLADARIALEFARPLVYRAAWTMSEGDPDASVHVSMAKAMAGNAALLTARKALQCHGAIGYSYEYDLHLFMKRAWALAAAWGDAAFHRASVGRAIL
ncbi:MAG: acyl-CoA dehydrogenase [Actinobacteria bacterium]|nr:acyl-CoA dehydrogenase [Actinomycetota bacterium]